VEWRPSPNPTTPTRRQLLEASALGMLAAAVGATARPARAAALTDADLMRTIALWRKHSKLPIPMPSLKERAILLSGKLLKSWLPPRGNAPVGAMGMVVSDLPRDHLWLGSADGEHMSDEGEEAKLIAHHLPRTGDEMFRWYGFVDLPSPFADRHFLIRTTVNTQLARNTDDRCWERTWALETDGVATMRPIVEAGQVEGLTLSRFDRAIFVPANLGGWASMKLPNGQTLFCYHASSSLGGEIPDKLVNRVVMLTLGNIVNEVVRHAGQMGTHYTAGHPPIQSGRGGTVPLY